MGMDGKECYRLTHPLLKISGYATAVQLYFCIMGRWQRPFVPIAVNKLTVFSFDRSYGDILRGGEEAALMLAAGLID